MKKVIAVYLDDIKYQQFFVRYLVSNHPFPMKVIGFTEMEQLHNYAFKEHIDLLILDEFKVISKGTLSKIGRYIYFTEEEGNQQKDVIYKYQSVEAIVEQFLAIVEIPYLSKGASNCAKPEIHIISLFSPYPQRNQVEFSYSYVLECKRQSKVLYLNLGQFDDLSLFSTNRTNTKNLSDFIYYLKQNSQSLAEKFQECISTYNGVNFIPAVDHGLDIMELEKNDMLLWLGIISRQKNYDTIIFDFHCLTGATLELLRASSKIIIIQEHQLQTIMTRQLSQVLTSECMEKIEFKEINLQSGGAYM